MASYKDAKYLTQSTSSAFDLLHSPGNAAPHSGIYRCEGCGREIAASGGNPLPPQNHHQHAQTSVAIRWRLTVQTA